MAKTPSAGSIRKTPATKKKATPKTTVGKKTPGTSRKTKSPFTREHTTSESLLYEDDTKQYFSNVDFIPRRDKFMKSDPMSAPTFNQKNDNDTWCIKVGDLVCVEDPSSSSLVNNLNDKKNITTPPGKVKQTVSPFTVKWRTCQITGLFRKRIKKKLSKTKHWGPLLMEVRWFYRHTDLDDRNQRYEKQTNKQRVLFESDHVVVLDASLLLGRLILKQYSTTKHNINEDALKYPVPTVTGYCHQYYLHNEQDVIGLNDWGSDHMLSRGMECSEIMKKMSVRKAACEFLEIPLPQSNANDIGGDHLAALPSPATNTKFKDKAHVYYPYCNLSYPWPHLTHGNLLCPQGKRDSLPSWQLCVGDIIAVPCDESTPPSGVDVIHGRDKWYPYRVPWSHCEVTAIFRTVDKNDLFGETKSVAATSLSCQIRWFPRISEALVMCQDNPKRLKHFTELSNNTNRTSEEIIEGKQTSTIECASLLGPVYIDEGSNEAQAPGILIRNRRIVSNTAWVDDKGRPHLVRDDIDVDPTMRIHRGINASTLFGKGRTKQKDVILKSVLQGRMERYEQITKHSSQPIPEAENNETKVLEGTVAGDIAAEPAIDSQSSPHRKRELFVGDFSAKNEERSKRHRSSANESATEKRQDMIEPEINGSNLNEEEEEDEQQTETSYETRASCRANPFHVDVSALKSFYEEVEILQPVDSYDDRFLTTNKHKQSKEKWKVKIGDTVTIEVEPSSKDSSAIAHFPFVVPWAPAEVVSIYRAHKTKQSCVNLRENNVMEGMSQDRNIEDEIMIEVRWLYRPWEIPGASKKKTETTDNGDLEEVFETDQVDFCSADSILSPIQLHDVARPLTVPSSMSGMPFLHYQCSRLWSIHRRSFVPSGSLNNRVSRGRMHSAYKMAFDKLHRESSTDSISSSEKSWKESFQAAIQKLSLAAAAQDTQDNGMTLACRERERKHITNFLKKAISGLQSTHNDGGEDQETMNLKSSLFIAGPPGTGKTASVRSIISELQTEQHQGSLPEFNFIALNGMELRHPFDAYVKFWEAVSGPRKERLSAGDAVFELENYFCGADNAEVNSDSNSESDEESEDEEMEEQEDKVLNDENNTATTSERPVTVLMLDEIDYLVTRKETLVYNFFDWPLRGK